jgi:hypothetical protein
VRWLGSNLNMKCNCEECNGSGSKTCPKCDGQGVFEGSIENMTLQPSMHNYAELVEIKKDASRVKRLAARLAEINPARAESYAAQLETTIFVINRQAENAAHHKRSLNATDSEAVWGCCI